LHFRKYFLLLITGIIIIVMSFPLSVYGKESESVYELQNSSGKVTLRIKMKDGEISITARSKAAASSDIIRWESIGYSISRNPINKKITVKDYEGPGPLKEVEGQGVASIYFEDGEKTWYEEGDEIVTTITFNEDKIKTALKDDFSDLKKGTTIYLHGIFQSYKYESINNERIKNVRKTGLKNWQDIINAENWTDGTLSGFSKYFNMPIQFMPSPQKNSIHYIDQDGNYIAQRANLSSGYVDDYVTWSNQPTSINYYESSYKLLGYYVVRKADKTRTPVEEGYISKGKNISQIRSGRTRILSGGMDIYLVYNKENTNGPDIPNKQEVPKKANFYSEIDLPSIKGQIKADPNDLEYFDVMEGIPTTESLYAKVEAAPYGLGYRFDKKVGSKTYPVKVKKDYVLSWYEEDGQGEKIVTILHRVEQIVNITRSYGYWEISNIDLYSFSQASIGNYALPNEVITLEATDKDLKFPNVTFSHSSLEKDHIFVPDEITNGITLKTQTIYGDTSKPAIPKENFTIAADRLIPAIRVKNDSLIIDGQIIMDSRILEIEGPQVDINKINTIRDQGKSPNKGSTLIKDKLVIMPTKENGIFESSGVGEYKRIISHSSNHKEKIEVAIENINSVTIHTPVVCNPVYVSDNNKFVQLKDLSPSLNLILDTSKETNDFILSISNSGFHTDKKGYGSRDYTYSLRDKNISYMAEDKGNIRNEIKFPFDIYHYDSKGDKTLISKDTWIVLSTDSHEFSLPIWVEEGSYIASCRSIAVNANLSKIDETCEDGANTKLTNYVARASFDIEVSGRIYGLTIYDISDYPVWQDVFRVSKSLFLKDNFPDKYMEGTSLEGFKKIYRYNYTVGTRDQYGNQTSRLNKYTFPLVNGSHPSHSNQGILKTGYGVRFRLTTIGDMFSESSKVVMSPRFYYVDKNGKNRREVDLYYQEEIDGKNRHLVKVYSPLDEINMKFQEVGNPYMGIPRDELENTASIEGMAYENKIGIREGLFTFGNIQISSTFRTFPYKDLKNVQNWYGYYYLPSVLHIAPKGFDVYKILREQGINFSEDFWLDEGYIIVNMDIRTFDGYGNERLSYSNRQGTGKTENSMWQLEGFTREKITLDGLEFEFEEGDFIIYKINSSVLNDYIFDGL